MKFKKLYRLNFHKVENFPVVKCLEVDHSFLDRQLDNLDRTMPKTSLAVLIGRSRLWEGLVFNLLPLLCERHQKAHKLKRAIPIFSVTPKIKCLMSLRYISQNNSKNITTNSFL